MTANLHLCGGENHGIDLYFTWIIMEVLTWQSATRVEHNQFCSGGGADQAVRQYLGKHKSDQSRTGKPDGN
jgi:hypothetical protein